MLSSDLRAQIRHWFYAEHWKVGTIAQELGLHPDAVHHALETEQFNRAKALRPLVTDPYVEFIRQTLQNYPRLGAARIYQMIRERGYTGEVSCSCDAWWPACGRFDRKPSCDFALFRESKDK